METLYHDTELVEVYDAINASRDDFDFYNKVLPHAPAPVLDIGCGTGTFALDMARRGYAVTAVDPAPQMIAVAMRKDIHNSVEWVTGHVSDLPRDRRYETVFMTGHAFQCLLQNSQIAALFGAVAQRLQSGGSFWFETRNPATKPWLRWTPEYAAPPVILAGGRSVQVVHEVVAVCQDMVTFKERYNFSDKSRALISQSTLRFPELNEIIKIAVQNGLTMSQTFGNWGRQPLRHDSPEIIIRLSNVQ